MQRVNPQGLYGSVQASLPHCMSKGWKGRIIVVSPPIYSGVLRGKTAYALGKVGTSVLTKGLAMNWEREGKKDMAITSIWPAATINSATTQNPSTDRADLRKPIIHCDAILAMLRAPIQQVNGCLELDEGLLRKPGVTNFAKYSLVGGGKPGRIMPAEFPDLTVAKQNDESRRMDISKMSDIERLPPLNRDLFIDCKSHISSLPFNDDI